MALPLSQKWLSGPWGPFQPYSTILWFCGSKLKSVQKLRLVNLCCQISWTVAGTGTNLENTLRLSRGHKSLILQHRLKEAMLRYSLKLRSCAPVLPMLQSTSPENMQMSCLQLSFLSSNFTAHLSIASIYICNYR